MGKILRVSGGLGLLLFAACAGNKASVASKHVIESYPSRMPAWVDEAGISPKDGRQFFIGRIHGRKDMGVCGEEAVMEAEKKLISKAAVDYTRQVIQRVEGDNMIGGNVIAPIADSFRKEVNGLRMNGMRVDGQYAARVQIREGKRSELSWTCSALVSISDEDLAVAQEGLNAGFLAKARESLTREAFERLRETLVELDAKRATALSSR